MKLFCIAFELILIFYSCHPTFSHIIASNPAMEGKEVEVGESSRKIFQQRISSYPIENHGKAATHNSRSRRSPSTGDEYQPSADIQTITSGRWQGMDPYSLLKLVNNLATSKEAVLPENFYGPDYDDDLDPIDLVSGGKKTLQTSPTSGRSSIQGISSFDESTPLSMGKSRLGKRFNRFRDDYIAGDSLIPQAHRAAKKSFQFLNPLYAHNERFWPQGLVQRKGLVNMPYGEIAFTPRGLQILKNNRPPPSLDVDERLPLIRRLIL